MESPRLSVWSDILIRDLASNPLWYKLREEMESENLFHGCYFMLSTEKMI